MGLLRFFGVRPAGYSREWALVELGKPVSSLTHEDLLLYQRFLADPQPAARRVMPPGRKLPRHHPGWDALTADR